MTVGVAEVNQPMRNNGDDSKSTSNSPIQLSPLQRLSKDLKEDERCKKELTVGKRIGYYRLRGDLGNGNFAQVKLGMHCLARENVAVKILDKTKLDDKTQKLLSREIASMEKIQHPNIIQIFEVIESISNIYLVIEYAPAGELFHKILNDGKIREPLAKTYFTQMTAAVSYMHSINVIHRDIKAENVFISSSTCIKLGDLGFSTFASPDDKLDTFCGSPPYAAPELFKDDFYLGPKVDIWALGILLFFMVTGTMPFRAETVGKLKKKILAGIYTIPEFVSPDCRFLIRQILRLIPYDRWSLPEIMRSTWLEGNDFPAPLQASNRSPKQLDGLIEDDPSISSLLRLGVTQEMIDECPDTGSRSNIIGLYRILRYQEERQAAAELALSLEVHGGKNAKESSKTTSKFCTIL